MQRVRSEWTTLASSLVNLSASSAYRRMSLSLKIKILNAILIRPNYSFYTFRQSNHILFDSRNSW